MYRNAFGDPLSFYNTIKNTLRNRIFNNKINSKTIKNHSYANEKLVEYDISSEGIRSYFTRIVCNTDGVLYTEFCKVPSKL